MRGTGTLGIVLLLSFGCGRPLFESPRVLAEYKPDDARRRVVGRWIVEFARGDSLARGELELTDSLGSNITTQLRGRLAVDLTPVVGEPMPCLVKGTGSIAVQVAQDTIAIAFAGSEHCWLRAIARWYGDSAVGRWTRPVQISEAASRSGRFRMWRY